MAARRSAEGKVLHRSFLNRTPPPARWDSYASAKIGDPKYDDDLACLDFRNGETDYHAEYIEGHLN